MESKRGFTLIELLVVISIIGVLSSVVLASLDTVRDKARDARRLSDMDQIHTALELYYSDNGQYPGPTSSYGENSAFCGGWDTSREDKDGDGTFMLDPLVSSGLMAEVPRDPLDPGSDPGCGRYDYFRYNAGSYGCDASKGAYFVLGVRGFEATNRPHPQSPGWSCPERNWQGEFDWVIGGFEN